MSVMRLTASRLVPRTTAASSAMTAPIFTPIGRSANHPSRPEEGEATLLMTGEDSWGGGWADGVRGASTADGAVDVEGEQELAGELVGAPDQVAGGTVEGVRRCLEVPQVHVDDVGDAVDQQAHGLPVQP